MTLNEARAKILAVCGTRWNVLVGADCWFFNHSRISTTDFCVSVGPSGAGEVFRITGAPDLDEAVNKAIAVCQAALLAENVAVSTEAADNPAMATPEKTGGENDQENP